MNRDNYLDYLNRYPDKLEGIYTTEEEIINFISNNSHKKTKVYKTLKIITYDKYIKKYYKMHQVISKYYRENPNDTNSFNIFFPLIKEDIKNDSNEKTLENIFLKFKNDGDCQNAEALIRDYTGKIFYPIINTWLLNIEKWTFGKKANDNLFKKLKNKEKNFLSHDILFNEKNAFFIGQLMFKLNYKIKEHINNPNDDLNAQYIQEYNEPTKILYRGMHLDYIETLSYPIQKGKIISFSTFTSSSIDENIAKGFAEKWRRQNEYSILMTITVKQEHNLFPLYLNIEQYSLYNNPDYNEKERLFHPFTFFRITNFTQDYVNNYLYLNLEAIGKREILELGLNGRNK